MIERALSEGADVRLSVETSSPGTSRLSRGLSQLKPDDASSLSALTREQPAGRDLPDVPAGLSNENT